MRIFVTGGTGFIGHHVVKELQNEDNILLLLSRGPESRIPGVNVVRGDLSDIANWENVVKEFRPQIAIHMAWESLPNYNYGTSILNLNHGLNLVTWLARSGCESIICTGSCWEYGQQTGELHEDQGLKPLNAFTAAKNALHWLGREVAREHDMRFIWARLFYVYGPGQRKTSLIPYLINCVRNGEKPEIKTPRAKNDFIYVEDVAKAITAIAMKHEKDAVYNIGSGSSISVQQVINTICHKFNVLYKVDNSHNVTNNLVTDFWADISRINNDFGWKPHIGISEGIEKTINYYAQDKR